MRQVEVAKLVVHADPQMPAAPTEAEPPRLFPHIPVDDFLAYDTSGT